MKYLGLALLVLAAWLIASAYRRALRLRASALEEVVSLARYAYSRVSEHLEPPAVWAAGYQTDNPAISELLRLVRGGRTPTEALSLSAEGLMLLPELRELAYGFFDELGSLGASASRAGRSLEALEARLLSEREECEERGRVVAVMALMLSAGGAILII